jgi:hypothetical protein
MLPLSTVLIFDCGIVPTVWHAFFLLLETVFVSSFIGN